MEKKEVEISKDGYLELIRNILKNKDEERELALDRYKIADEQMDSAEQFALQGKNAVSFLTLASDCTDSIANIAKEIKSIVYKDAGSTDVNLNVGGDFKDAVSDFLLKGELEKNKKKKEEDTEEKE